MKAILLSIKPEFADKIINGEKRYEFRRRLCREKVGRIYLYATSPVKLVLAEAEVEDIIWDIPESVWERASEYAGIDKGYFERYFAGRGMAGAYCLGKVTAYAAGKSLSEFGVKVPPQSFVYINE